MADEIKGMFVQGGALHIVRGSDMWSFKDNGKEPNEWDKVQFASVGTSEEFIEQFSGEMKELADAGNIYGDEREALKESISTVLVEGLMPAFEDLKKIRASVTTSMVELNRKKYYEDFARVLWHAYSDLMPIAGRKMGYNISFLFADADTFEAKLTKFQTKHPDIHSSLYDHLRSQRVEWQNALSDFRNNHLEHRKGANVDYSKFYMPDVAEIHFDRVWRVSADLLFVFLSKHLSPSFRLEQIPVAERDPIRPRRFRYAVNAGVTFVHPDTSPR